MSNEEPHSAPAPGDGKERSGRTRMRTVQVVFLLLFGAVIFRLVRIQVIDAGVYRDMAARQYQTKVVLPGARGILYDRNGNVLASNSLFVSFAADPKSAAEDVNAVAGTFAKVFGKPKQYYAEKLRADSRFTWLERQVPAEYLTRIDPEELPGVFVRYEPKRLYHNDHVAGQLVGFTDIDNRGVSGVELEFDKELRGIDGYVVLQRDGMGHARPAVDYPRLEPSKGHDVYLTIDLPLQSIVEGELKKGIDASKSEGGLAIVLQPWTGEILAAAQYPTLTPSEYFLSETKDQRLRAVTDVFEPGSVFKVVTASAALEYGLVKPQQQFYAEQGTYVVTFPNGQTRKITDTHEYGWLTFQQAMAYSSNIVMAKISDLIGPERFYKTARDFGFGIQTGVELPGEVKGTLKHPSQWSAPSLNNMAYGYEIGVTPIQIVSAYAAVANGGTLMKPYILKKETDPSGTVVRESHPEAIRRVVSGGTAGTLKQFFSDVVVYGTAKPARLAAVTIAGKTGTSRKYAEGKYESGNYTASFAGFFPVDRPAMVCLVMLDHPQGGSYTGGTVSAPVVRMIAERAIGTCDLYADIMTQPGPQGSSPDTQAQSAPVQASPSAVKDGAAAREGSVPNVTGFSVRRAVALLVAKYLEPVVKGSGVVVSQDPAAGQPARKGMKVVLTCQPKQLTVLMNGQR
jgi:cell division protein FtsI (penicillin-binding protein 3)